MAKSKNDPVYDQSLLSFVKGQILPLDLNNVVHTKSSLEFKPKTKFNIGYIVAAVIFNDKNEVLLIQEAKLSCRGLWYLPAGRVEPEESLQEGVSREVEEEAGLQFKPVSMVAMEVPNGSWYRFTFTGTVTGGELKTEDKADGESIQAAWFPFDLVVNPQMGDLHLRSHDIIPLVHKTKLHQQMSELQPDPSLPLLVHHSNIILRLLMVCPCENTNQFWYLRKTSTSSLHLPAVIVKPYDSGLNVTIERLIQGDLSSHLVGKICGLLNLEYQTADRKPDGICFNLLYLVDSNKGESPPKVKSSHYTWEDMKEAELEKLIKAKIQERGTVVIL